MKLSVFDWIWCIKGKLSIEPTQSSSEAFVKIESLFQTGNTNYKVDGETLTFTKNNPLPQDKMSIFDSGVLRVSGAMLHYDLKSRALLACFLAPLFFFALGHAGVAMDQWRNPPEVVKAKAEAAKKRSLIKPEDVPMNPVDKALGAPVPEKKKDGEEIGKRNRKPSMKTAYTYMGIFFALWIAGRILEHKLVHNLFRKRFAGNVAVKTSPSAPATDLNRSIAPQTTG